MTWSHDTKWIGAKKLMKILEKLPKGSVVAVNAVGNLSVHDTDLKQIGHIDIGSEEFNRT